MSAYRMVAHWYPHPEGYQPDPTGHDHATLADAEHQGQRWGCLAGVRRVEVYAPDGTLQALWDKDDPREIRTDYGVDEDTGEPVYDIAYLRNRWQRLGAESVALGRAEVAALTDRLRAQGRLPRNPSRPAVQ